MFKKIKLHYQQWNRWQKCCMNSRFHKILVLLGLKKSQTLEMMKAGEKIVSNMATIFGKFSTTLEATEKSFAEFGEILRANVKKGEDENEK